MSRILFLLLLITGSSIHGQVPKKLQKIFPFEVQQVQPRTTKSNGATATFQFDTSLTKKGDTTGVHNGQEFLSYGNEISKNTEIFKLLRMSWVTNKEYDAFCEWVLDSLYREELYKNTNPTGNDAFHYDEISQLLNHGKYYKSIKGTDSALFDPSKMQFNRARYSFNYNFDWRKRFRSHKYIPILSRFILQPAERLNRQKELDERLWYYKRSKDDKSPILVARDREVWAKKSLHPYDVYYNLANHYYRNQSFENHPVQGILGVQAAAYLQYLELQYQQQIDKKELPYRVRLSLPNAQDIPEISQPSEKSKLQLKEVDMTTHWQITNADYLSFFKAIRDSIIREALYANTASNGNGLIDLETIGDMLDHPTIFYDESVFEWREFDPSDPGINIDLFPFDLDFKWTKKIPKETYLELISYLFDTEEILTDLEYERFLKSKLNYRYFWRDLKRKAAEGSFYWDATSAQYIPTSESKWNTKDKDMGNGLRRSSSYYEYKINEMLNIHPTINCVLCNIKCEHDHAKGDTWTLNEDRIEQCGRCAITLAEINETPNYDFTTNPESLIQDITYEQALAYYNWKYLNKFKRSNYKEIIYDELLPSEDEFKKVQSGEKIIRKAQQVEYPTPFFRYVINIYVK